LARDFRCGMAVTSRVDMSHSSQGCAADVTGMRTPGDPARTTAHDV
jgi:hypothetical protein